jgi:hypothetical protein
MVRRSVTWTTLLCSPNHYKQCVSSKTPPSYVRRQAFESTFVAPSLLRRKHVEWLWRFFSSLLGRAQKSGKSSRCFSLVEARLLCEQTSPVCLQTDKYRYQLLPPGTRATPVGVSSLLSTRSFGQGQVSPLMLVLTWPPPPLVVTPSHLLVFAELRVLHGVIAHMFFPWMIVRISSLGN